MKQKIKLPNEVKNKKKKKGLSISKRGSEYKFNIYSFSKEFLNLPNIRIINNYWRKNLVLFYLFFNLIYHPNFLGTFN